MSTKYTVDPSERWSLEHATLSDHATERWDQRLPAHTVAPETAYEQSQPIPEDALALLTTGDHDPPDRARVWLSEDGGFGAVFLIAEHSTESVIMTVYRIGSVWDDATRAYLRAVATGGGR